MKRLLALFAFVALAAFLLVLAVKVPSPDLVIVIGITLAFVGFDFATSSRDKPD